MENIEQVNQANLEQLKKIADELDELQKVENDGRGVTCVRDAVAYLRIGKLEGAKQICRWDHDKIINYPRLVEFIKKKLFTAGEEHPWSVLEKLRQQSRKK